MSTYSYVRTKKEVCYQVDACVDREAYRQQRFVQERGRRNLKALTELAMRRPSSSVKEQVALVIRTAEECFQLPQASTGLSHRNRSTSRET